MNTQNFKIADPDLKFRKIKNGEVGYITDIIGSEIEVTFDSSDEPVRFTKGKIEYLDFAYAMTIHKSQGSEAKHVIMPCISNYRHQRMMSNQLIYTALTRAKKDFTCVGSRQNFIRGCMPKEQTVASLRNSIRNNTSDMRITLFSVFLRDAARRHN